MWNRSGRQLTCHGLAVSSGRFTSCTLALLHLPTPSNVDHSKGLTFDEFSDAMAMRDTEANGEEQTDAQYYATRAQYHNLQVFYPRHQRVTDIQNCKYKYP